MWLSILVVGLALIVFSIGTIVLVRWAIKQPSIIKVVAAILYAATIIVAIRWALHEFL